MTPLTQFEPKLMHEEIDECDEEITVSINKQYTPSIVGVGFAM